MKKITFTFCALLLGLAFATAQEFSTLQDYFDAGGSPVINANNVVQPTVYSRTTEATTLFATIEDFNANCDFIDELAFEDFTGGPIALTGCGVLVSAEGDACYPVGELVEGFEMTTSGADIGNTTLYLDPADGFGTLDPAFGSNTFVDFAIINFTDEVTSFAFDLYSISGNGDGSTVTVRIFTSDGEVETIDLTFMATESVFVGGISDVLITSIELEDTSGTHVELISNFTFGLCGPILTDEPEDALTLTVGEVFEDFPRDVDNTEATASPQAAPSCGDFQGGDSWYTVTVPSSGNVTVETGMVVGSAIDDTVLAIYEGTVDALTEIACNDNSDTSNFSLVTLMDRTPGEELFIRVFEAGNDVQGGYQIAAYSDCAVSAPEITIAENGLLEIELCISDTDTVFVDVVSTGGIDIGIEGWVITGQGSSTIIGIQDVPPFELDATVTDNWAIYNIRYNEGLVGLEVGASIDDLEGCFELSNPVLINGVSEGGVCDTCEFTLEMNDSFGDGWNGAEIDILVNGIVALDNVTLANGAQGLETFINIDGAEISVVVENLGTFPGEVSYRILDNIGQEVAVGDLTTAPDPFMGVCVDCLFPEVDFTVELLCDQGLEEFIVILETTSLSDSSQLVVTNEVTGDELIIDSEGSLEYGPFSFDTAPFTISVTPDNALCAITFDVLGPLGCPPSNDNCIDAIAVTDGDVITTNTSFATVDLAGCSTADTAMGVWYFINDGGTEIDVIVDTAGSSFDTELSYFTGTCDALVCVGNNDDAIGVQSEISFNTGGTGENIYILATGFGTATGDLVLNVTSDGLLSTEDENFVDNDITLFPNPAINDLEISSRELIESVNVYNLSGQVVLQKSVNATGDVMDVSNLTSGVYLMQLISNGQSVTKKFIKK